MILEFKTSFDNCSKLQAHIALNEVKKRFVKSDYLPNKWNSTEKKNKEGYSVAQFRVVTDKEIKINQR